MDLFKQFTRKKIGLLQADATTAANINKPEYSAFIKILLLKAGSAIQIDFTHYALKKDALFFINPNQWYKLEPSKSNGYMIYYNRDFYCVEIHDKEVACDGILYNNVYDIPVVFLTKENMKVMEGIALELAEEIKNDDSSMEEMLRILLKEIIIKSTRIWKSAHNFAGEENKQDIEFLRKFSQLIELHFKQYHTVSDYADILNLTPKALNKRIGKYGAATPNDLIKDRIILEAKRLLVHTALSVKEIAYTLGYEDPAYFNRLFTKTSGIAPAEFRKDYKTAS